MATKLRFIHRNNNWLNENGYTRLEEVQIFDSQLQDILDNTRWYLDNIDFMKEYRVSWHNYTKQLNSGQTRVTMPHLPQPL